MPSDEGADLARQYKTAARALQVAPDQYTEQVIKEILSNMATVVDGVGGVCATASATLTAGARRQLDRRPGTQR